MNQSSDYHVMISERWPKKAIHFMTAINKAGKELGLNISASDTYQDCQIFVLYGLGGPDRIELARAHLKKIKTFVAFDLGYWDRYLSLDNRKYRVSINGFHPKMVMDGERPTFDRWIQHGVEIRSVKCKKKRILLVGNSPKSNAVGADGWSINKSKEIRSEFPGYEIAYRPKPQRPIERGVIYDSISKMHLDDELRNVSLVVCRHSNVAVDACKLGTPVVCDDGAAAAIYPHSLKEYNNQPSYEVREEFLHRISYWQWSANEAKLFWQWLFKAFPAYDYR